MNYKLRPWKYDDLESLHQNADNSNINKFMSDGFPTTIEKWKSFIDFTLKDQTILYLAIEINGQAVGGIGINPQKDIARNNAELGYWLAQEYWGKGIMTNAIKDIVRLGFEKFSINRIYAKPFETNIASHKVLEKAGFVLEARFHKTVIKNSELLDELIYAIRK
ncbi:MAG: GNAT family protein [Bacteroidota bacterium]